MIQVNNLIQVALENSRRPVVFCSFGKDSIVLLDLVRKQKKDVDVIFFREPFFQKKFVYAQKIMADLDLAVYDYPPSGVDYIQIDDYFEIFNFYNTGGKSFTILYGGCCEYVEGEPFLCALNDWIRRPTVPSYKFPWDCVFWGQKECDPTYIAKEIEMKHLSVKGDLLFIAPLKDWTNKQVWEYIKQNSIPYDTDRYDGKNDSVNPDKYPTCFKCLDYRENESVVCPKTKQCVKNCSKSKEQQEWFRSTILSITDTMKEVK